jgi:hypothetical protein
MHKCFVTIAALITAAGLALTGCSNPSGGDRDPFVPVTTITGLPSAATAGIPLTLTGTVEPSNATNKAIVWSVENPGTTGAAINGNVLTATAAGTVVVLATVVDGGGSGDYTHNFPITVSGGGGALTVNGLPSGGTWAVYIFNSGADISTYDAISTAYLNGSYQALGASPGSDGAFTLYAWNGGSQGGSFTGNGSFPALLLNGSGSITDTGNPMYSQATVSFSNGAGAVSYGSFTAVVYGGSSGSGGALTINGLPAGGTRAVYVFNSGTDISTYDAISSAYINGSYQALGASLNSDGAFTLYAWTGGSQGGNFSGNGSFPVLLLNSGGSITDTGNPMYAQATVSFSNGAGAVSYGSFTAVVYDGGSGGGGTLTINGLPAGGTRAVYIFSSGTDISTYDAITSAYANGSYQALGASPGSNGAFTLYTWTSGSQGGGFSGNGSFPVLLLNASGSITDAGNPMYAQATVSFSSGTGAASYGSFTAVVYGDGNTAVTASSLSGKVTAPVRGETPDTTAINEAQYTGTIVWQTSNGTTHTGAFAASTVYRAVVTLTAKTGYTFDGVGGNSFTYTGATSVTNAANSGTVTITFPATERDPNTEIPLPTGNPSVKLSLDGGATVLAHGGTTDIAVGTGTYTVSVDSGYYPIVWYLNGTELTQYAERTSITLSKRTAGIYLVTVVATANGVKQSGAHTFVVQ